MSESPAPPHSTPRPSGPPRCMSCGYELVGLRVEADCPECGRPIWSPRHMVPPTSGFAITSLVLGIVSLLGCMCYGLFGLPFGIAGIVFGELAARQVKAGIRGGSSKEMAMAGRICSWIGASVGLVVIVVIIVAQFM